MSNASQQRNSLLTGKFAGNSDNFALCGDFLFKIGQQIQSLSTEFPIE